MDLRKLKTLIDLVSDSDITELDVTEGDGRVRIVKANKNSNINANISNDNASNFQGCLLSQQSSCNQQPVDITLSELTQAKIQLHEIKSPMVGTFYTAPASGATPFVKVGDTVAVGQVLCIIEAMKLLNEIESDKAGIIQLTPIENGQAVEYGQTLFLIE